MAEKQQSTKQQATKQQTANQQTATSMVMELSGNGKPIVKRTRIIDRNGQPMSSREGNPMYEYAVHGTVRGNRKVKVELAPKDLGGYEPLDILFDEQDVAELDIHDVTTEMNGVKTTRTIYTAVALDGTGYKCDVKPKRNSDQAKLDMLFIDLKAKSTAAA